MNMCLVGHVPFRDTAMNDVRVLQVLILENDLNSSIILNYPYPPLRLIDVSFH